MRKRREEFPELIKEQKHRSYYAHHEENRAKNAERYQREREHRLAYAVEYRKANRESLRIWHREGKPEILVEGLFSGRLATMP
jgi:hypothetical protein